MIVCHRCGHENPDGQTHCLGCRAFLAWLARASGPAQQGVPTPVPDRASPPAALDRDPAVTVDEDEVIEPPFESAVAADAGLDPGNQDRRASPTRVTPAAGVPVRHPGSPKGPQVVVNRTRVTGEPERAAPRRTIAVSVGEQTTRYRDRQDSAGASNSGFAAVRPGDHTSPEPSRVTSVGKRPLGGARPTAGETKNCRVCGLSLPVDRHFCRCGATLSEPPRKPQEATRPRLPWYRRLRGPGSRSEFRHAMKAANGGYRVAYDVALSMRARMFRLTMFLGAMGIGVSQFGPWGGDVRGQVHEWVKQLVDRAQIGG